MPYAIKTHPDDDRILRKKCRKVEVFDKTLELLYKDMLEAMKNDEGVGIAANQIGISKKIIICIINEEPHVFVNPRISSKEGSKNSWEGCLSVPGIYGQVERFTKITVKAQDIKGKPVTFEAEDFTARVFQHEIDHLNGILFIDKAQYLKTKEEFDKMKEENEE
jgi:peptide deformylase